MGASRWICGVATVLLATVASVWAWNEPWLGPLEQALSLLVIAGTAAALVLAVLDRPRARTLLAAMLLLGTPALRLAELCGVELSFVAWDRGPVASITAVAVLINVVGLLRRRLWARWLGIGGALAGFGCAALNGLGTLPHPGVQTWGHACAAAGCGAMALLLSGPSMRDAFEGTPAESSLWRSTDPLVRAL
ncbi:MAG: hypothetical protein AB1Z98_35640, partial [Nannocystaceae bacterium]